MEHPESQPALSAAALVGTIPGARRIPASCVSILPALDDAEPSADTCDVPPTGELELVFDLASISRSSSPPSASTGMLTCASEPTRVLGVFLVRSAPLVLLRRLNTRHRWHTRPLHSRSGG